MTVSAWVAQRFPREAGTHHLPLIASVQAQRGLCIVIGDCEWIMARKCENNLDDVSICWRHDGIHEGGWVH